VCVCLCVCVLICILDLLSMFTCMHRVQRLGRTSTVCFFGPEAAWGKQTHIVSEGQSGTVINDMIRCFGSL
jgi:hypothetical protein